MFAGFNLLPYSIVKVITLSPEKPLPGEQGVILLKLVLT